MLTVYNFTQHELPEQYKNEMLEFNSSTLFCNIKDINPELFKKLSNSPSTEWELKELIDETIEYLISLTDVREFVFPIGSPAFMGKFFIELTHLYYQEDLHLLGNIVMLHSDRIVKDLGNGKKQVDFVYQNRIAITDY